MSPDGKYVAVGTSGGDIFFYSSTLNRPVQTHLSVDDDPYDAVAVTFLAWTRLSWLRTDSASRMRVDRGIVAGFEDGVLRVPVDNGVAVFQAHSSPVECLVFSADEKQLATSSGKEIGIYRYDASTDKWAYAVKIGSEPDIRPSLDSIVRHLSFTLDGERLLAVYMEHGIWFWNARTGRRMRSLHAEPATRLGTASSYFSGNTATVAAFNMRDGYDIYPLTGLSTLLNECWQNGYVPLDPVLISPQARLVWGTSGHKGKLRAWSIKSGRIVVGKLDHGGSVHTLKSSGNNPNNYLLLSAGPTPGAPTQTLIKIWRWVAPPAETLQQAPPPSMSWRLWWIIASILIAAAIAWGVSEGADYISQIYDYNLKIPYLGLDWDV